MRRPIGDQNATRLLTVWTGNAIIFAWAFLDFEPTVDKWQSLLIVPLIVAATAILNGIVDSNTKDIMVFGLKSTHPWRRVFSDLAPKDDRIIDLEMLKDLVSEALPVTDDRQHAVWYMHSISVENNPYVMSCRRDYLFSRDYASVALLFLPIGFIFGSVYSSGYLNMALYGVFIVVQWVATTWFARRHGKHYTTTVLATYFATIVKEELSKRTNKSDTNDEVESLLRPDNS